ncbi:Hypothetical_protein [Hexamita inflata]|uniref:Hypothetical_protein n=1 Tax=Hexamita inflata TaxID=28002 RepID=A0ABP1GUS1_9EUKA
MQETSAFQILKVYYVRDNLNTKSIQIVNRKIHHSGKRRVGIGCSWIQSTASLTKGPSIFSSLLGDQICRQGKYIQLNQILSKNSNFKKRKTATSQRRKSTPKSFWKSSMVEMINYKVNHFVWYLFNKLIMIKIQ